MLFFFPFENEVSSFKDTHLSSYMFFVCSFALYFGEISPEAIPKTLLL